MFSTLRTRFGIPGVISVIALVFAMFGGAYAASNSSNGGKATASAKAKKGPRGKTGKTGPAGPQGLAGPAGAKGDPGAAGSNGSNGAAGADGKSVTGVAATVGECSAGGVKYTSASGTNTICNGKNGTNGQTGFTETLPEGKTETGVWGTGQIQVFVDDPYIPVPHFPISFPIPTAKAPVPTFLTPTEKSTADCPGRGEEGSEGNIGIPMAEPGHLCVYASVLEHATLPEPAFLTYRFFSEFNEYSLVGGTSSAGTTLRVDCDPTQCAAGGTWAVTGPEE